LIAYLRSVAYFADADASLIEMIAAQMFRRTLRAGETVFLEGDRDAGLCLVERGRIKIFKLNPDGAEHILHIVGEGGTFNDIACLDDGPCPASAGVLSDAVIHTLPTTVFQQILEDYPQLALRVVRLLAGRVRGLVMQIENLSLYSVIVRLTRFLLQQAEDPSLSGPGVTRTAIAAHINTTPQTISTALRSLEDLGAIEFDRHQIKIVNEKLMRSIANL
jgi:CRP/FNR family transcriptional regulator